MKPVRLGVIGCGVIGTRAHLPATQKSKLIKTVAVADLIPTRADEAAKKFGVPKVYYSGDDLLKDENIEAVVLAMPVGDRTPMAYKALKHGKHVLLEKPVAANVREVERMMALRGDLVVGVCSPRNALRKMAQAARKCYESGTLGKLRLVRARALLALPKKPNPSPPPWRQSMAKNGGGILVNWSCYELDLLMSITGWSLRPQRVLAQWWPIDPKLAAYVGPDSDADAHYTALITCEDDIVLSMERAEFAATPTDQAWEIIGSDASLSIPMRPQAGKPNAVMLHRIVPGKGIVSKPIWEESKDDGSKDVNVLVDFAKAIREGRETTTNLERALIMQRITDGIYKSAKTGQAVSLEPPVSQKTKGKGKAGKR